MGMQTREEDFIEDLFITSTHNYMLFFTNLGKVYRIKAYEIPEAGRTARGTAIVNLLQLAAGESITAVISLKDNDESDKYLLMVTKNGIAKKTSILQFKNIRKGGLIAINVKEDDELISVKLTDGNKNVILATKFGQGVCFNESEIRDMGRNATGVKAITLGKDDEVIDAELLEEGYEALTVTENGYGKRTDMSEASINHRGGKGVKIYKITEKTGNVAGVKMVNDKEELMLITSEGTIIRLRTKDISTYGRIAQGVKLMNLEEGVKVVSVAKIAEEDIETEENYEEDDNDLDIYPQEDIEE